MTATRVGDVVAQKVHDFGTGAAPGNVPALGPDARRDELVQADRPLPPDMARNAEGVNVNPAPGNRRTTAPTNDVANPRRTIGSAEPRLLALRVEVGTVT